jgi:hypothetical protein
MRAQLAQLDCLKAARRLPLLRRRFDRATHAGRTRSPLRGAQAPLRPARPRSCGGLQPQRPHACAQALSASKLRPAAAAPAAAAPAARSARRLQLQALHAPKLLRSRQRCRPAGLGLLQPLAAPAMPTRRRRHEAGLNRPQHGGPLQWQRARVRRGASVNLGAFLACAREKHLGFFDGRAANASGPAPREEGVLTPVRLARRAFDVRCASRGGRFDSDAPREGGVSTALCLTRRAFDVRSASQGSSRTSGVPMHPHTSV